MRVGHADMRIVGAFITVAVADHFGCRPTGSLHVRLRFLLSLLFSEPVHQAQIAAIPAKNRRRAWFLAAT